jgi:hypothetical protein
MSKTVKPAALQDPPEPELEPLSVTKARSTIGVAVRSGDTQLEATARRQLAESNIAACIDRELAKAPKLTPAQIGRLHTLLRSGGERQPRVVNR